MGSEETVPARLIFVTVIQACEEIRQRARRIPQRLAQTETVGVGFNLIVPIERILDD